jgi:hypothetical protein
MDSVTRKQVLGGSVAALAAALGPAAAALAQAPALQSALTCDLDITGITTRKGRTFACAQARGEALGPQVVEIVEGKPRPFPDAAWNAWKEGDDGSKAFVGVSALRVGQDHALWVIDRGAPRLGEERVFGAAKAVRIDLDANQVTRVYDLAGVTRTQSAPAQIRFNGLRAYIADEGWPGIIVLKIATGETWRALTDETLVAAQRPVRAGGRPVRSDGGRIIEPGAGLIEVAPEGDVLYLQPPSGPMARIATRFLDDPRLPPGAVGAELYPFAATPSSWGTAMDAEGTMYVSDIDRSRILTVSPKGKVETLFADPRLAFVAALWIDDAGNLLAPAARLDQTGAFDADDTAKGPFTVWSYPLGVRPLRR